MNVFSLLNGAVEAATEPSNSLLTGDTLLPLLLSDTDFDDLLADATELVDDAISDIGQVVESATLQIVTTLEESDVAADAVDISGLVEDLVNAIAELPEDTTIDTLLSELDIAFLSDEQLLDLLNGVNELLDNVAPGLRQLEITPVLEQGTELLGALSNSIGTITIDGSNLSGELTLNGTQRTFTTDTSDDVDNVLADVDDFLSDITGEVSLSDGQFIGDITLNGTQYELNFDITKALTDSLVNLFTATTPLSFTNGVVAVDIDTALGDVDGTIDFSGGDLDFDLITPFGNVDTSIDFPANSQFNVPLEVGGLAPLNLELDFAAGVVSVPLLGGFEIPLDSLSGEVVVADELATLTLDAGLPVPISTSFAIGPLASVVASELIEDFNGELTFDNGVVDGTIASRFGEFPVQATSTDLVLQARSVIDQTTGMLTLGDGVAGLSLDNPFGEVFGSLAFASMEDSSSTAADFLA